MNNTALKYVVKTLDGRTYEGVLGVDIKKTLDKRNRAATHEAPQIVYECRDPKSGLFIRVWNDEIDTVGGAVI